MTAAPERSRTGLRGAAARLAQIAWRWLDQDRDLLLLWLGLAALQTFVPPSPLSRADLAPWCALALGAAAALRARPLGQGPHPALPPRQTRLGPGLRGVSFALIPVTLLFWIEAGRGAVSALALAPALTLALLALRWLTRGHARTAWAPRARQTRWGWLAGALIVLVAAWGAGALARPGQGEAADPDVDLLLTAASLGLSFLAVGLFAGRLQHLAQRQAVASQRPAWWATLAPFALALLGPPLGLVVLLLVVGSPLGASRGLFAELGFDQAYIVALYVIAWARVLWPRPVSVARTVILHEVVPSGGRDAAAEANAARTFGQVPVGALRFNPNRIRRTRVLHTWLVPVLAPRVLAQDDPVVSPWAPPRAPAALHALGEARFEPDPISGLAQSEVITLTLAGDGAGRQTELSRDGLTRRVVVLRSFPRGGLFRRARRTFAWEPEIASESVQVIGPGVRCVYIREGDVILIASGGRAMAYEVELGATTTDRFLVGAGRPAQLEDYARVVA